MRACETCRYWRPLAFAEFRYGGVPEDQRSAPWGQCKMIGQGAGHYGDAASFEDFQSERAFTSDASDYQSWLTTRADFSCAEYVEGEPIPAADDPDL